MSRSTTPPADRLGITVPVLHRWIRRARRAQPRLRCPASHRLRVSLVQPQAACGRPANSEPLASLSLEVHNRPVELARAWPEVGPGWGLLSSGTNLVPLAGRPAAA